jgi:uncharacterized protein
MFELVLQVQDIDERGKDYDFELTPSWLDAALSETALKRNPNAEGGRLHVHAQRNGADILVTGKVDASLLVECGRCLQETPLPVHAEIAALLSPGDDDLPEDLELAAEDLDRGTFVGHELALDDLVREHLLLECPMQPLCSPDCAGIEIPAKVRPRPEDFGAGATDPRLLPLQQLKAKLSGGKPDSDPNERDSRGPRDLKSPNDKE